jgi:hypothetical protein
MTERPALYQRIAEQWNNTRDQIRAKVRELRAKLHASDRPNRKPHPLDGIQQVLEAPTSDDEQLHLDILHILGRTKGRSEDAAHEINEYYKKIQAHSVRNLVRADLLGFGYRFGADGQVLANLGNRPAAAPVASEPPAATPVRIHPLEAAQPQPETIQVVSTAPITEPVVSHEVAAPLATESSADLGTLADLRTTVAELAVLLQAQSQSEQENYANQLKGYIRRIATLIVHLQLDAEDIPHREMVARVSAALTPLVPYINRTRPLESGQPALRTATTGTAADVERAFEAMSGGAAEAMREQAQQRFDEILTMAQQLRTASSQTDAANILTEIRAELTTATGINASQITQERALKLTQTTFTVSRELRTILLNLYQLKPEK